MVPRVALIHDFLLDLRGAERVFAAICDAWPEADVFTAVYDEAGTEGRFADRTVHTSFLQRLRPTSRTFRPLLPFYPHAVESFDLRGYDTVISSSSAWAHGVLVDPGAVHVCYCHNPFRYAWTEREATLRARGPLVRPALRLLLSRWRQWDWIAAQRVDRYVANSRTTAERVRRYLGPRVDRPAPAGGDRPLLAGRRSATHYVVLAELMAHKRIDVAVEAFTAPRAAARRRSATGPEGRRLRAARRADRHASPAASPTQQVAELAAPAARALVVTAVEEFGIAAVEALAAGRPGDRARRGRGARERRRPASPAPSTSATTPAALAEARAGASTRWPSTPAACRAAAERFSVQRFQDRAAPRSWPTRVSDERRAAAGRAAPGAGRAGLLHGARRSSRRSEPKRARRRGSARAR